MANQDFTTYAQYNEDLILAALLHKEKKGFYVDVGANHPIQHSVTKHFYKLGWTGLNIEPNPELHALLQKDRPRDINFLGGISDKDGELELRIYHSRDGLSGLSTFSKELKDNYKNKPKEATSKFTDISVKVTTLKNLIKTYKINNVDFMKIDVEGFEHEALKGMDWKLKPKVLCIEANHIQSDWRPLVEKNGYRLFIADGLNNYYVQKDAWHITEGFAERVTDLHSRTSKEYQTIVVSDLKKRMAQRERQFQELAKRLEEIDKENIQLSRLSLNGQPYVVRVKRAVKGLTVDWLKSLK